MNDEDLVRRFVTENDSGAFEELIRRRLPTLRRIVAAAGPREHEDREDILQEVLIRVHRSLKGYRFDAPLNTWLFRIARNAALDEEKKRRRARNRELRVAGNRNGRDDRPGPEELAVEKAEAGELKSLFYRLKESDRQLLLLREREGLSMEEIGSVLGLPPGTVKSRLSRARNRARKLYEEAS